MIGMQVGDKNITLAKINAQGLQPLEHGLQALFAV